MEYDYVIVGGGTAGCVLAHRLSEDPKISVLVIEGGPTDQNLDSVLKLKNWINLLNGPLDYSYPIKEQARGNSHIIHSRAKVLGGCSSHNTLISFFPFPEDMDDWVQAGAKGWEWENFKQYAQRVKSHIQPVAKKDQNALAGAFIDATHHALRLPKIADFAQWMKAGGLSPWREGVGWLSVAYHPETGTRSSASVAYVHDILGKRKNLTIWFEAWTSKLVVSGPLKTVTGVHVQLKDGRKVFVKAKKEVCLCAGAIDSPRLLLLSGIGPRKQLEDLNIPVVHHLPGVGENLLDHPETIIMWKTGPQPLQTVMKSEVAYFIRRPEATDSRPDMMSHIYQIPFAENTERLGYPRPEHAFCVTPNIPRPKSKGKLYLTSSDPQVKPELDFQYFTDPEDYDAKVLVDGIKQARLIAQSEPFKTWLLEEVAPGPHVQSDEDLSLYARKASHTVYHPAGTCKMGAVEQEMTVVDPDMRVKGLKNIRIVDASIFPSMISVNPMITVIMIGEKASDLILRDYYATPSKL
ncbi:hypothetical protein PGT21_032383 [Puccinia graminis f. sp. tritici]|uniref:Glucose-methanol-choline oxidoreductase N-terminal domain-containing protein n=1 Tax=Puccinia graminis f. sp. tritici TaxID=56615 RepID=A0A5B0QK70_PUCGR|nr:hypothetical protein PGT21_032383 [Puccinia graminis f. sp. tritici]